MESSTKMEPKYTLIGSILGTYIGFHVSFYDTREVAEIHKQIYNKMGYILTLRPYFHEHDKQYRHITEKENV